MMILFFKKAALSLKINDKFHILIPSHAACSNVPPRGNDIFGGHTDDLTSSTITLEMTSVVARHSIICIFD